MTYIHCYNTDPRKERTQLVLHQHGQNPQISCKMAGYLFQSGDKRRFELLDNLTSHLLLPRALKMKRIDDCRAENCKQIGSYCFFLSLYCRLIKDWKVTGMRQVSGIDGGGIFPLCSCTCRNMEESFEKRKSQISSSDVCKGTTE